MGRRSSSSVTNFLSDIVDDIKDFVDDEVIDRGRDTERDLRKAGRNWFDSDDDDRGSRRDDVSELAAAVKALSAKVDELAAAKK
ncbi:MAG TPA: hypothetical protein VGH89_41915 [Pseudonocardia sp.]|jgi:hypothetical protein